jgi:serpin B
VWVDTSATLQPAFARRAAMQYGATARTLPLRTPEVVPIVNHWADSVTAGLIPEIRRKPFGGRVEVAITNAAYFRGLWLEPFDTALTRQREFTTAAGERLRVATMDRRAVFAYRRGPGYQALRLPYRAGLTAMYLVLPDSGLTPAGVLDSLVRAGWPVPDPRREMRDVHLRLPRLHVTQATDLRRPLTVIGMGIVFDSARADFGGLVVPKPGRPPPCPPLSSGIWSDACTRYRIQDATQHVFLEVDEQGTEAAAVTSVAFEAVVTSVPPPPIPFYVDRPFLLALRDEKTGTLLFVGYVPDVRQ